MGKHNATPEAKKKEVIRLWLNSKDNRLSTISEKTGVKFHTCSDIIDKYLKSKQ